MVQVSTKKVNINKDIRAQKVMLIDEEGKNVGVVLFNEALYRASSNGLDLVEVGTKDNIPVCKIINYGKWIYEQNKKKKKSAQPKQLTKEIKLRPNTCDNDLIYRAKHVGEFIIDGHKIKISIKFKGREQEHMFLTGQKILERFLELIPIEYKIIENPSALGSSIIMLISG